MDEKLKDQDVLLVKEKGGSELHAVNLDKNGKVKSSKLDGSENPDFLKIDKNGNVLENFFENFKRQIKDPTRFDFYRAPLEKLEETVKRLYEAIKSPDKPENKDFLDAHRIEQEDVLKKQAKEQGQTQSQTAAYAKTHAINPDLVDWQKFERFGITREALEKSGNFDKLLDYQKTNLMPVEMKFENDTLRSDARFSLRRQEDDTFAPSIHLIRHKPDLERPYFGVEFTKEDRDNLLKTGNLGRIVEAEYRKGEKTPIFLSIDRLTNEIAAIKASGVKVPDTYQGVSLNEQQKKELGEGKAVYLENMKNSKGEFYSGNIQYNADKRYFAKVTDSSQNQSQNHKQEKQQTQAETTGVRIPKKILGVEISQKQQDDLRANKTIYVKGMVKDGQEEPFNAYIKVNAEKNKLDFFKFNPDKAKKQGAEVTPANESKTQVAVNSEGKTNEATKNAKEPLKQGQTQPTEKQEKKEEQKRSRSRKI
ncbi:hypothetical protein FACS189437_01680 [Bacteroidia bacterium]|nr:hypothetical protein FACS189437_01680 [Bacteroidia bacterium]